MRNPSKAANLFLSLPIIVLLLNSCSKKNDEEPLVITPTVNPAPYTVQAYLLTPNDQGFNADYYRAARATLLDLQSWYKDVVDTVTGLHSASWYTSNNGEISNNSPSGFFNTKYEMKQILGSKFDTTVYTYFVFVATGFPDETIPRGIAVQSSTNLDGLLIKGAGSNMYRGADGHALGHAFGLPEVAVPNADGIMSNGWPSYPNCVIKPWEKDSLNASPFFQMH
jgi:hypothetical protein